jgi:hypothetical protein
VNKAQARRGNKHKGKYAAQFAVTIKNKERNVLRDGLLKLRPDNVLCSYALAMRARRARKLAAAK